jgi:hypothetical protein
MQKKRHYPLFFAPKPPKGGFSLFSDYVHYPIYAPKSPKGDFFIIKVLHNPIRGQGAT